MNMYYAYNFQVNYEKTTFGSINWRLLDKASHNQNLANKYPSLASIHLLPILGER